MSDLANLTSGAEDFSLEELITRVSGNNPVGNRPSNVNMAATTSLVSGSDDDLIPNFNRIMQESSTSGSSATAEMLTDQAKATRLEDLRSSFGEIAIDPDLTDEQKISQFSAVETQVNELFSMSNMLATQSGVQERSATETDEQETVRISLMGSIARTNVLKAEQQAFLNSQLLMTDTGVAEIAFEFVETLLPWVQQAAVGRISDEVLGSDKTNFWRQWFLSGSTIGDVREILFSIPIEDRLPVMKKIAEAINNNSNIDLITENDLFRAQLLQQMLDVGGHTDADVWVENAISLIEGVGFLALFSPLTRTAKRILRGSGASFLSAVKQGSARAKDAIRDARSQSIQNGVSPVSPSQVIKDVAPSKAKAMHEAMVVGGDEVAEALYGTTKNESVANDVLPQVGGYPVKNKVANVTEISDARKLASPELLDFVKHNDEVMSVTHENKRAQLIREVTNFRNTVGLTARSGMYQVERVTDFTTGKDTGNTTVWGVFGPEQGGWRGPDEALQAVDRAFAGSKLSQVGSELLRRLGDRYVNTDFRELEEIATRIKAGSGEDPIDVLVRVPMRVQYDAIDVEFLAPLSTKKNQFDRLPLSTQLVRHVGTVTRNLFDPASIIDPSVYLKASYFTDRASLGEGLLRKQFEGFRTAYNGLDKDSREVIGNLVVEANAKGLEWTRTDMVAMGLSKTSQEALIGWRQGWDSVWYSSNLTAGRELNRRGFLHYTEGNTTLFVSPHSNKGAYQFKRVYDETTGTLINLTKDEIDTIYSQGGFIGNMSTRSTLGTESFNKVVVRNGNLTQPITDATFVMPYRKGYYPVKYKDPYFIDKEVVDANGKLLYTQAVATGSGRLESEAMAASLQGQNGTRHFARPADEALSNFDKEWEVLSTSGHSAERLRGNRLQGSIGQSALNADHIMGPMDAVMNATRAAGSRVSMVEFMESYRARIMNQFSDLMPRDEFGQPRFTTSVGDIKKKGFWSDKDVADARTNVEYYNYLQQGYVNSIDVGYKAGMKTMAQILGGKGLGRTEKVLNKAGDIAPLGFAKNASYQALIALNPIRQLMVQPHQALQLAAIEPLYFTTRMFPQITYIGLRKMKDSLPDSVTGNVNWQAGYQKGIDQYVKVTGWTAKEAEAVYQGYRKTGFHESIHKQNLVRGALVDMTTELRYKGASGSLGPIGSALGRAIEFPRKIGFDLGEEINLVTAYLTFAHRAQKAGKNIGDAKTHAEVTSFSRNFTYGMNKAGDVPYNQSMLNVIMQFMQVPHKAALTMTTNRGITTADKIKLASFNAVMYGLPVGSAATLFGDWLPGGDDPASAFARDAMLQGIEGALLNASLSAMFDQDVSLDWSSLAPLELHGMTEQVYQLFTGEVGTLVADSPAASVILGQNNRVGKAWRTIARYTNLADDFESPTEFAQVVQDFLSISSGFSNAYKAIYAFEVRKKMSSSGTITDENVSSIEAAFQIAGIPTMDEKQYRLAQDALFKNRTELKEEVKLWYGDLKRHLSQQGTDPRSMEFASKAFGEAFRVWGATPLQRDKAMKMVQGLIQRDIIDKDFTVMKALLDSTRSGMDFDEIRGMIKALDMPTDQQESALGVLDSLEKFK